MSQVVKILERTNSGTLVLLDELGPGPTHRGRSLATAISRS